MGIKWQKPLSYHQTAICNNEAKLISYNYIHFINSYAFHNQI